jgi:predicted dehydrogenase
MEPVRVGIVGSGNVLNQYLDRASIHPEFEIAALADLNQDLARSQAEKYGIPRVLSTDDLIGDDDVELVVNFTPPRMHAGLTLAAIAAGKHVFTEKPFAHTLELADEILAAARAADVKVACAPATFLGGGMQTVRKLVDDGWIGRPVAGFASFTCRGYEHWHPNIDPFYARGAGPMLDIGPYLVTNMLNVFGPVVRVSASAQRFTETRPRPGHPDGPEIPIEVATHVAGTLDFASGAVVSIITSWEMWNANLPMVEIYGTEGSISAPNPDNYGGEPRLRRGEARDLSLDMTPPSGGTWVEVPMSHRGDAGRAIGIAEMSEGIRTGRPLRTGMDWAYHALEVMLAFEKSSESGGHVAISSTCDRPAPLPPVSVGEPFRFDIA